MKKKWYKKISNWLTILFVIIVVPLIMVFGIIMIKAKLHPDKIPDFMGYKPLIVLSGSMENEIHIGDLVIVKMVDSKTLKEKDIIAYRNKDNTATLHRIIDIKNENGVLKYVIKGDNNPVADNETATKDNIEGLFLFKINGMGNVLMFLQKPYGLLIICIIIISLGTSLTICFSKKKGVVISKDELEEFEKFKKQQSKEKENN